MKLYEELAAYWPLLSAPEDHAEEAAFYWRVMQGARSAPIRTAVPLEDSEVEPGVHEVFVATRP